MTEVDEKYELILSALKRERQSRKEAERIIEQKALELHYVNTELKEINKNLENRIKERTKDIEQSNANLVLAKKVAEEATAAKSEFLSNMTHELRTPLNGVIGLTELVLNEKLDGEIREMLENIRFSANHLANIINEILDFSKIEAGKISFENIEFNLNELIHASYKNLFPSAKNKSIELLLEYDKKIPEIVKGDPVKLNQILNNIVGNAIKFTSKGFVKLDCKLLNHNTDSNIVEIQFNIKDTGIGIKREDIGGIFKSFTQSDSSISRKFGGTGLGLTITKSFIELQDGSLTVESTYGLGSDFNFIMPFQFISTKSQKQAKSIEFEFKPMKAKVLIVDDVVINQMVVGKILNNWKIEVDIASSGKQALHLLKRHKYDLIVMDVQMPEMSGTEATRIIRNDEEFSHVSQIPIIAFTANAFEESKKEVLDAGMDCFVSKPVKPQKLYEAITRILNNKMRKYDFE